jgi:hypothetical protein
MTARLAEALGDAVLRHCHADPRLVGGPELHIPVSQQTGLSSDNGGEPIVA